MGFNTGDSSNRYGEHWWIKQHMLVFDGDVLAGMESNFPGFNGICRMIHQRKWLNLDGIWRPTRKVDWIFLAMLCSYNDIASNHPYILIIFSIAVNLLDDPFWDYSNQPGFCSSKKWEVSVVKLSTYQLGWRSKRYQEFWNRDLVYWQTSY